MPAAVQPQLCPLCGKPNACAMAAGQPPSAGPCWCTRLSFDAGTLGRVPEELRGQACLCEACARVDASSRMTIQPAKPAATNLRTPDSDPD